METLEIIIGFIFIFLLLSLLATTVQELWASLTSLRGKMLLKGIVKLLEIETIVEDETRRQALVAQFSEKVKNTKVFQKCSGRFLWAKQLPSYLSAEQVSAIIQELMREDTPVPDGYQTRSLSGDANVDPAMVPSMLQHIKQDSLYKQLETLHKSDTRRQPMSTRSLTGEQIPVPYEVEQDEWRINQAKAGFKKTYDEIMDRTTGWYKRSVQAHLLVFGLLIALAFDADTFKIYNNLTYHSNDRQQLLSLATNFVNNNASNDAYAIVPDSMEARSLVPTQQISELRNRLDSILVNEIRSVPSPVGLGWEQSPIEQFSQASNKLLFILLKLAGWLVTALAISMGAPFWFDLLQKVVNLRNSGTRPQDAEKQRAKA